MAVIKAPSKKLSGLVLLPVTFGIAGYLILSWVDGQWWSVVLWVIVAPLLYLAVDFFMLRESDSSNRSRRIVPSQSAKRTPAPQPPAATPRSPEWRSARRKSAGGEILERGRRYDRR